MWSSSCPLTNPTELWKRNMAKPKQETYLSINQPKRERFVIIPSRLWNVYDFIYKYRFVLERVGSLCVFYKYTSVLRERAASHPYVFVTVPVPPDTSIVSNVSRSNFLTYDRMLQICAHFVPRESLSNLWSWMEESGFLSGGFDLNSPIPDPVWGVSKITIYWSDFLQLMQRTWPL